MPRTVRDARIETRSAREKLAVQHEPYWRAIDEGAHLGYRKGKRGGKWIGRYRPDGGSYVKSVLGHADDTREADGSTVLTYRQAQESARAWFADQAASPTDGARRGPYTVGAAMDDYLVWYEAHRKPQGLEYAKNTIATHIRPKFGSKAVNEITTREIEGWHGKLATTPARVRSGKFDGVKHRKPPKGADERRARKVTANRILIVLRAGLNRAFRDPENGIVNDAAWRRVEPFEDVTAARVRYLGTDECVRLINASAPDFRKLVQAALLTGCRYGELITMECSDFISDAGTVHVRETKGGKPRHVPLNDEGVAFFDSATAGREGTMFLKDDGEPWARWQQQRRLAEAAKIAGIEDFSFHALRHTYGSQLAMNGTPMSVIAKAMGHSDSRMTEKHYAHLAPSYVAETIRANLPKFGIGAENVTTLRR